MPSHRRNGIVSPAPRSLLLRIAAAVLLCAGAMGAHAATVYRCVAADGRIAYRDTPCGGDAKQTTINLQAQPLIGAPGEAPTPRATHAPRRVEAKVRAKSSHRARAKPATSWECRAADGEVFYRHSRCPSSVPGDGTVRSNYAETMAQTHPRRRRNAWSRVRVRGKKIPRAEACRRIHSAAAAGRDGHLRDATVSTYAHLTGHDPCADG